MGKAKTCDDCKKPAFSECPECSTLYCASCTVIMEGVCTDCAPKLGKIVPERKLNKEEREFRNALVRVYKPALERMVKDSISLHDKMFKEKNK